MIRKFPQLSLAFLFLVVSISACNNSPSPQAASTDLPPPSITSSPTVTVTVTAAPPTSSPTTEPTSIQTPVVPVLSCDIMIHGWEDLHLQPCLPPSRVQAGLSWGWLGMIDITDPQRIGVALLVPAYLQNKLKPGKYILGASENFDSAQISAGVVTSYDTSTKTYQGYSSYPGGTLILTQTGKYLSGSFSFGAYSDEGRQINVDGSFENIPFSQVNLP